MQRHWRILELFALAALAAFIAAIMTESYMVAYGVAVSGFVVAGAYLIAVARFPNRMDPEGRDRPPRPRKGTA